MNGTEYTMFGASGYYNLERWLERARRFSRCGPRLLRYTNAERQPGALAAPLNSKYLKRCDRELTSHPGGAVNWIIDCLAKAEISPLIDERGIYQQSLYYHKAWAGIILIAIKAYGEDTKERAQGRAAKIMRAALDPSMPAAAVVNQLELLNRGEI